MKILGVTGGIGSGKSTVCNFFNQLGIAVYEADTRSKALMATDENLKDKIRILLGNASYIGDMLNRKYIATRVFGDAALLQQLNQIVHPAVLKDFETWIREQNGNFVIKESAIMYENHLHEFCDFSLLVTAPVDKRLHRVIHRDQLSQNEVLLRMQHQWSDAQKIPYADFVIQNIDLPQTKTAVLDIYQKLVKICSP